LALEAECDTFSVASVGRPNVEMLIHERPGRAPNNPRRDYLRAVARLGTQRNREPTAAVGWKSKSNKTVTIFSCQFAGKSKKAFDYFDICLNGEHQTTKNHSSIDIV